MYVIYPKLPCFYLSYILYMMEQNIFSLVNKILNADGRWYIPDKKVKIIRQRYNEHVKVDLKRKTDYNSKSEVKS